VLTVEGQHARKLVSPLSADELDDGDAALRREAHCKPSPDLAVQHRRSGRAQAHFRSETLCHWRHPSRGQRSWKDASAGVSEIDAVDIGAIDGKHGSAIVGEAKDGIEGLRTQVKQADNLVGCKINQGVLTASTNAHTVERERLTED
jgi:hypothetical protein